MAEMVQSVTSALEVLDCFLGDEELGVSEVARRIGVAKSTAHRLLSTLAAKRLVTQSPENGKYHLGMHLYELGFLAMSRNHLRQVALPTLAELRRRSGMTVQLAMPDGADVVYTERLETHAGIALMRRSGHRLPAFTTSSGKAIAAFNPAFAEACVRAGFTPRTDASLTSVAEFNAVLDKTRKQHGALSFDEATVGVGSCAAPLHGPSGEAIAAVSLVGPTEAFRAQGGHFLQLVTAAAAALSRHGVL